MKKKIVVFCVLALLSLLVTIIGCHIKRVLSYAPQILTYQLCGDIAKAPYCEFTLPVGAVFWIALAYDNADAVPEIITGNLKVFNADNSLLNEYAINIGGYSKTANWLSNDYGIEKCAVFRIEEMDEYPREKKYAFEIHIDGNPRMSLWIICTSCKAYGK